MQVVNLNEVEKIFKSHNFRDDTVPSTASSWLEYGFDTIELKRWLECDVTSAKHAAELRDEGVLPDFWNLRWYTDATSDENLTLGAAYCQDKVDIEHVLLALRSTLRGGIAIHADWLRKCAVEYDNLACAAMESIREFEADQNAQTTISPARSTDSHLKSSCVKTAMKAFEAAHKEVVNAAQMLLNARKRYVLEQEEWLFICSEFAQCIIMIHDSKYRSPGALTAICRQIMDVQNEQI